jgi:zinc protease
MAIAALLDLISGSDPRVTMNDPQRINAQTLERAQAWLERLCREAPIEVAVVGEITQEQVMPLIEKYLGSLPERPRSAARLDRLRRLNRAEGPLERRVSVDTITPQAMVFYGFVGSDARQVRDSRALELAGKILDSQLIERVREELGLVYSIGVQSEPSAAYHDAGMFVTGAPCAPDKADELVGEIETIFTRLAEEGPTEEELANAQKQVLNNLDTRMKEPTFWWGQLQYAHLHKVDLDQLKHVRESFQAFTCEQVRDVFRKYYVPQRMYHVIAVPASPESPAVGDRVKQAVPVTP